MKSIRLCLLAIALLPVTQIGAQSVSRSTVSLPAKAQPVDSSGYLNKTPSSPLRFATPPRPPVASLPPLTITQDPKPVFSARFVEPTADVTLAPPTAARASDDLITSVQWPELVTQLPAKQGGIPENVPPKRAIAPQSLVRHFESLSANEKLSLDIEFQVPSEKKTDRPSETAPKNPATSH